MQTSGWDSLVRVAAMGPVDAWLRPRLAMSFRPASSPIVDRRAKVGGQPVWLDEPFWPVSANLGAPTTFVGQFPIPGGTKAMGTCS